MGQEHEHHENGQHVHHHHHFDEAVICALQAIPKAIIHTGALIMSAISEFATKQNAHNDKIDTAVSGLQGDVQTLTDTIKKLQESAGQITPEDQALLDAIDARAQGISDKLEALDALTPPATPTA